MHLSMAHKHNMRVVMLVALVMLSQPSAAEALACPWCKVLGHIKEQQMRIYLAPLPHKWAVNPNGNIHYQGVSQAHPFGLPVPPHLDSGARAPRTYPTASSQLWDTYMFSAGQWWLRQARISPLRVETAEEADVVLVPLATLNLMTWEVGGTQGVRDWYDEVPRLLPYLGKKPHVIVLSKGEYDFINIQPYLADGTHDTRIRSYGLVGHPPASNFTFITHGLAPKLRANATSYIIDNVINVPFPSWVHFSRSSPEYHYTAAAAAGAEGGDDYEGAAANAGVGPGFDVSEVAASKTRLVSMSFKTRMPFRQVLRRQCKEREGRCSFLEVQTVQVAQDRKGHVQNATQHLVELVNIASATRDAWFCAMPPGDQPLRKAMYDCMELGAIPVLFDSFVLDTFTFSDIVNPRLFTADLSPDIASGRLDLNTTNFVDYLERAYPVQKRLEMLAKLHEWQRIYQYALDPVHELISFDSLSKVHPMDDAFTLSWKATLRSLCQRGQIPAARCAGGPAPAAPRIPPLERPPVPAMRRATRHLLG